MKTYSQAIQDQVTIKMRAITKPLKQKKKRSPVNVMFWLKVFCFCLVIAIELGAVSFWTVSEYSQISEKLVKPTPIEYNCAHVLYSYDQAHQLVISTDYTCH